MKSEAKQHPKMLDLAERLNIPIYGARGLMEGLWLFGADYAMTGCLGKYSARAIAQACGWDREPAEMIDAMVAVGFLDRHDCCSEHALVIHDWNDHVSDYVRKRLNRKSLEITDKCPGQNGEVVGHAAQESEFRHGQTARRNDEFSGPTQPKPNPTQPNPTKSDPTQPRRTRPNPPSATTPTVGVDRGAVELTELAFAEIENPPEFADPPNADAVDSGVPPDIRASILAYMGRPSKWELMAFDDRSYVAKKLGRHGVARWREALAQHANDPPDERSLTTISTTASRRAVNKNTTKIEQPEQPAPRERKMKVV